GTAGDLPDEDTRVMERVRGTAHAGDPNEHAVHGMGGLVMALDIRAPDDWRIDEPGAEGTRLYIHTDSTPGHAARRFGFVVQHGAEAPAPDSVPFPGPPLILRQGPPASIRLVNRTSEPTQIHWHGLELESYFDGVAGATGYEGRRTPAILPGDSFDVALRTDRPGTYIYHTHMTDLRQQASGLYGPLVVLPRDAEWDPEHDRIFIAGWGIGQQPELTGRPYLNGTRDGETLRMRAGETYRLRLINITMGNGSMRFRLVREGEPVRWTPLAHDAYDLPERQRTEMRAEQTVSVGETYDFEYTPEEDGELRMEIRAAGGALFAAQRIAVAPPPAPPAEQQIAAAVQAAPEDRREGATVLGYGPDGALSTLREGTNDMICLADDPASASWSVACYHASLDAFMQRGRDLRAEGTSGADVNAIRWKEVEDGTLSLPRGAILYVLHGSAWDAETGAVVDPYLRWVIYTPFATAEETGLPLAQRAPGEPWLMSPGTAGAHIMITPARDGG
ncbi:MAG: multicopper oxidase domain-containing protein, partial [Gemmatimonadetes bacterium]|nr:multicopper oxidase domain-containing protein [Gemmatimonadota bacterium]NIQ55695.1 multicopper oxidase domain-containing protein [Gemmatimonadota bacterium]NIU75901.1 multicopper oxidase domain-containing protein [Gammaproteobacteria bacterium]NIX45525.1 multicopper oxidase domain-containing protein [Gemmatimonadota bacterium]